ncbi:MAG: hypothetical protein ACJ8IK_16715 [Burkholderiaceae bacterium]
MGEAFGKRLNRLGRARPLLYRQGRFEDVTDSLLRLMADARDVDQRIAVRATLASHYQFIGNKAAALQTISEQIDEKPDDLQSLIALAEHFHYCQVDLFKAADAVERALAVATAQSFLVRQVLGTRMRIALETGEFELASDSLSRLIDYKPPEGALDVAYERDFIKRIPPGVIEPALIARYIELLPAE